MFALPRAQPGGPDSKVLCYSAKEFLSWPTSIYKVETKPHELCVPMAPSQVLKCHFLGSCFLPRAGCTLLGKQEPFFSFLPKVVVVVGLLQFPPTPRGPEFSDTTLECFLPPRSESLNPESKVGLKAFLGPAETRVGLLGFCRSPGLGLVVLWQREPPTRNSCLWPGPRLCLL